jgi:hypothetical protein
MMEILALPCLFACVAGGTGGPEQAPPLTPQQAMRRTGDAPVTVEFQVLSVFPYGSIGLALSPEAKRDERKDQFVLVLSDKAQQQLRRVGIHDLSRHFRGKDLRATGRVQSDFFTGLNATGTFFRLTVDDISQLEKVD